MRIQTTALAAIVLLSACGGNQAVQLDETDESVTRWSASMSSPPALQGAVQMSGTAWMAEADDNTTRVHISIDNAAPGGRHPWMVQRGRCGAERGVLGSDSDYQPLQVDRDGTASATVVLDEPLPSTGTYSVAVLASPTNHDLVVACGNLAPPIGLPF